MKPIETWARQYRATSSYQAPPICVRNQHQEVEKMQQASNSKDIEDKIEQDIEELGIYIPNAKSPTAFMDYKNRIRINISSNFPEKGAMDFPYTKTIEIYAQVERPFLKKLTNLLTEKGFEPLKKTKH